MCVGGAWGFVMSYVYVFHACVCADGKLTELVTCERGPFLYRNKKPARKKSGKCHAKISVDIYSG
jgi:hypothetical protein